MNKTQAQLTQESLDLIRQAQQTPSETLAKAYVQSGSATTGITAYDLEAPAKLLFPVLTPFRNKIPRVVGGEGIQANWKAVTAINTGKLGLGVSEGNRGGVASDSTQDYSAVFKEFGLEQSVTWKAELAAKGFQDLKALAASNLLKSVMIGEERLMIGGNTSLSLANTATPTVAAQVNQSANGGAIQDNTGFGVGCVALSFEGYLLSGVTGGVVQSYNRANADGSFDILNGGTAKPSAQANVVTGNSTPANTNTLTASVAAVAGAVAYAWFWGANAGNLTLGAITTINSVKITANAAGTAAGSGIANFQALGATNNSTNSLHFDGFLTMAQNATLGGYQKVQATGNAGTGTPLTASGRGGCVEIDVALKWFWDTYKLSPTSIHVNSQEQKNITACVLSGNSSVGATRFNVNVDARGMVAGGFRVTSYLNQFAMGGSVEIPIKLHPDMPAGTIFFETDDLPYPLSNVAQVKRMLLRRDYYQIEWPMRTRKYEFGVYFDGVLQHYAPFSEGIITNIADGVTV